MIAKFGFGWDYTNLDMSYTTTSFSSNISICSQFKLPNSLAKTVPMIPSRTLEGAVFGKKGVLDTVQPVGSRA